MPPEAVLTLPAGRLEEVQRGVLAMLPVLVGLVPFALLLGAMAARKGLSPLEVGLLCGLNFAGGSEFVAIELWREPVPILLILAMTALVNSRHVLMGAALAPHLRTVPRPTAWAALYFMADETWAMALADANRPGRDGRPRGFSLPFYAGMAGALHLAWVAGTITGALLGGLVADPVAWGFDMAFPAIFLVLVRGMWRGPLRALPWLVSLAVAAAVHVALPGAWYVAAGALAGLATAAVLPVRR